MPVGFSTDVNFLIVTSRSEYLLSLFVYEVFDPLANFSMRENWMFPVLCI